MKYSIMKKIAFTMIMLLAFVVAGAQTNDFYDDEPSYLLKGSKKILVTGEVEKDITVDVSRLPKAQYHRQGNRAGRRLRRIYRSLPL